MPRMTHAQLIEATRLKLEELQARAAEKQQSEREKLQEQLASLQEKLAAKDQAFDAKIKALVEAHNEAQSRIKAKITEIELDLGATAPEQISETV